MAKHSVWVRINEPKLYLRSISHRVSPSTSTRSSLNTATILGVSKVYLLLLQVLSRLLILKYEATSVVHTLPYNEWAFKLAFALFDTKLDLFQFLYQVDSRFVELMFNYCSLVDVVAFRVKVIWRTRLKIRWLIAYGGRRGFREIVYLLLTLLFLYIVHIYSNYNKSVSFIIISQSVL